MRGSQDFSGLKQWTPDVPRPTAYHPEGHEDRGDVAAEYAEGVLLPSMESRSAP